MLDSQLMFEDIIFEMYEEDVMRFNVAGLLYDERFKFLLDKTFEEKSLGKVLLMLDAFANDDISLDNQSTFISWSLWTKLDYLRKLQNLWIKYVNQTKGIEEFAMSNIFGPLFDGYLCGKLNEIVENNINFINKCYGFYRFEKTFNKIQTYSVNAYTERDFNSKYKYLNKITNLQVDYDKFLNKNFMKDSSIKPKTFFERKMTQDEVEEFAVATNLLQIRSETLLQLYSKIKIIHLEEVIL